MTRLVNTGTGERMALIGYARVSTLDQSTSSQVRALRMAGCDPVHEENASGGDRSRPVLKRVLETVRSGDTLIVVRIDRLARSLSHLLEVIETLQACGAAFRSIEDPIDTSSAQGKFTLQVLGAAAEFERALIRERTVAGLDSARRKGRVGGNPGLREKDPTALRRLRAGQEEARIRKLLDTTELWVPEVRRLRPDTPWEDLTRLVNARLPAGEAPWSRERLVRATKRLVREGMLEARVLERAPNRLKDDRVLVVVAAIVGAGPDLTLQDVADRLNRMREPTPSGRGRWGTSSVAMVIGQARKHGLLPDSAQSTEI
jgi:DNA invertase Pin-like site-specific DNA recombinase